MSRYERQEGIITQEELNKRGVTIIGCGAIGRQLAIQLATMGVQDIHFYDPDWVEEVNLGAQGWFEDDLGMTKCEALAQTVQAIRALSESLEGYPDYSVKKFPRSDAISQEGRVVFLCVDSIGDRARISDWIRPNCDAFFDARMLGETIRLLSACNSRDKDYYHTTLFAQELAATGSCTARTTFYAANVAAGFLASMFVDFCRDMPVPRDLMLSLVDYTIYECGTEEEFHPLATQDESRTLEELLPVETK